MFHIQYEAVNGEHKMQEFDSKSRQRLIGHLAGFNHPIMAVYEQANPITNAMRKALRDWPGSKTRHAVAFAHSSMSPA